MKIVAASSALLLVGLLSHAPSVAAQGSSPTLDYETFKTKVQPVFVTKRPGHARCVACHTSGTPLRLQPLAKWGTTWTEEDSKKNFAAVTQRVAFAGNPKSPLLLHPLEETAGGYFYHSGGKHWTSQNDAEWQMLRSWIMGK